MSSVSKNNQEGYNDPTAYQAMKNVTELEAKASNLIKAIKFIIRGCGFELLNRIEIRDSRTGREFL